MNEAQAEALLYRAWEVRESDPMQALQWMQEGLAIARKLGQPCLALKFEHWITSLYLFQLADYQQALKRAIETLVETRKPHYEHCPYRIDAHYIVIDAYLYTDPHGFKTEIYQAIDLIETTMSYDQDLWRLLQGARAYAEMLTDQYAAALDHGLKYLARCEGASAFRLSDVYAFLTEAYVKLKDWDHALHMAQTGVPYARDHYATRRWYLELIAWQAYIYRLKGDQQTAGRYHRQATQLFTHLRSRPYFAFYDAWAGYHVCGGEVEIALKVRQDQLAWVIPSGSPFWITKCYYEICCLLKRLDRPFASEIEAAKQAAQALLQPDYLLTQLAQL